LSSLQHRGRALVAPELAAADDEVLFDGIRRHSESHFNALYERYFPRIYHFIQQRVRNQADAEELTQETFAAVFRGIEGYSGRSTPLAWIYGIAKNTVHSQLRRLKAHDERLERAGPDVLLSDASSWGDNPEEQLSLRRYVNELGERLGSISEWQAEVFVLRHVENLPIREIAARMQRSNDAIRSSLYRVKRLFVEAHGPGAAATGA
jgi:RNA polymerase sigma-70 factor (ECF subfamily)